MSYRLYPRNLQSRRDAIANHRDHVPRNEQSFLDGVLQRDGVSAFQNTGPAVSVAGGVRTIYEGDMGKNKAVFSLHLTNAAEKWAGTLAANNQISTDFLAGISSAGITTAFGNLARGGDQDISLTFSPAATFTRSAIVGGPVTLTTPANAFQLRSLNDSAVSLFTIAPASVTETGSISIHEAVITASGAIVRFILQNSEESWNTLLSGASHAVTAAVAAGVSPTSFSLTSSNFIKEDAHTLRLTLPATDLALSGDQAFAFTIPTSAFTLLGHNYAFGTFLTVINDA